MGVLETIFIILSSSLCLYLLKLLHKTWLTPIQIQRVMSSQGIRGPPYRFIHGNTEEINKMTTESINRPMVNFSHDIFPRVQPHLHSWLNTYGKNFLNWLGPKAQLVISEPEFAKEILNDRGRASPKIEKEGFEKKLLGDGIVASNGEKWAKQRKLANHAFRAESLKNMFPEMIESVELMLERWKLQEGKEIEVLNSLNQFWKSNDDIESDKLEQGIRYSIIRIMENREKAAKEGGNYGNDLLGLLVKAKNDPDENNWITIDVVVDDCKTFYLAGHDTTSILLSWTVLLLTIHTDWQDKAREKVLKLFGQENPNTEGIARMKVMNMIIHESLRLYPPVLTITRKVQQKVKLGNLVLPPNIMLVISTLALHGDPQIWGEDVHFFKPERFSEGVPKATNNNPAVYVPFGLGPRSCVGMNFAMNEVRIAL